MTNLIRILGTGMAVIVVTAGVATAQAAKAPAAKAPKTVDLSKYPAPVRATIEAETKNATIKGVSKETEKGKTEYEVETIVDGRTRDFMVDPGGKVTLVEEQIALTAAPQAVQTELAKRGTVLRLEKVMRGTAAATYEAQVKSKAGKTSSVELDADGKPYKG
jgi:uncharacterized membrane protein YkoI